MSILETVEKVSIEEIIGHVVEAEIMLDGWFSGLHRQFVRGRIVYSAYQGALLFMPMGARNKGSLIKNESHIISAKIVRKDKVKHAEYLEVYRQREELERQQEEQRKARAEKEKQEREERFQQRKREEEESRNNRLNEAKSHANYDEISKLVNTYYEESGEEYNQKFVDEYTIPIICKLVNKSIENINSYPKHFFSKSNNKRMCHLIESLVGIKLGKTQKGNVDIINNYLQNS